MNSLEYNDKNSLEFLTSLVLSHLYRCFWAAFNTKYGVLMAYLVKRFKPVFSRSFMRIEMSSCYVTPVVLFS